MRTCLEGDHIAEWSQVPLVTCRQGFLVCPGPVDLDEWWLFGSCLGQQSLQSCLHPGGHCGQSDPCGSRLNCGCAGTPDPWRLVGGRTALWREGCRVWSPEARPGFPAVAPSPTRGAGYRVGSRCPETGQCGGGAARRGGYTRCSTCPPCAGRPGSRGR